MIFNGLKTDCTFYNIYVHIYVLALYSTSKFLQRDITVK